MTYCGTPWCEPCEAQRRIMQSDGLCPECGQYIGTDGWSSCPNCGARFGSEAGSSGDLFDADDACEGDSDDEYGDCADDD